VNTKAAGIAALAFLASLFLTLTRQMYGGIYAYLVPSLVWGSIFGLTLFIAGNDFIRKAFSRSVILIGLSIAAIQIFLMIDIGLITGFGKNPLSSNPASILLSALLVGSTLAGIELSRSYILRSFVRKPALTIAFTAVLYTFVYVAFYDLIYAFSFANLAFSIEFMGGTLIPLFATNLFVSFLALLGGPLGAWAYMVPIYSLTWFSPILPDLSWGYNAMLGTLPPLIGFIYINYVITAKDFRKAGVLIRINPRERAVVRRREKADRAFILGWALVAAVGVSMVYFSVGLFSVYPVVPLSGSMSPAFEVGDLVLLQKVSASDIRPGDIIEYVSSQGPIIHRVKAIESIDSQQFFITQGDANNIADSPVSVQQVMGKLAVIVPKVGWLSLYVKQGAFMLWEFVITLTGLIVISCMTIAIAIYGVYRYRNRPYWSRVKKGGL